MTLICTIRSKVTVKLSDDSALIVEDGFYELPVHVKMSVAAATGDPKGFVQKTISEHLAGCVANTGLPLGEGLWDVHFSNFAQVNLNYPVGFTA